MPAGSIAYVSLGSNQGDSPRLIRVAMSRLRPFSRSPLRLSSLWRTTPVDCPPDAPPFINAVVGLWPVERETPESLLARFQELETEFGRRPKQILNEARPLDLDLICFGPARAHTARLTLPHPRAHLRRFVLEPLNEIAPDLVLPGQLKTARQLLADLVSDEVVSRLSDHPAFDP
jgi:2-amino-4-hydroxy-6-hydroxymethyldihydropteridine diphosphokinase